MFEGTLEYNNLRFNIRGTDNMSACRMIISSMKTIKSK